jgi:outer membrane lipoprotein carrier protein
LRGTVGRRGACRPRGIHLSGEGIGRIVWCWVRMTLLIVLPGWIPSVLPLQAQDARALAIMEEAGARYRTIDTFCASFHQSLEVPLLGETHYSSGELCQAQPDLFAMRWSDPKGDVVVADGDFFWVYYPSADPGQVLQFSMAVRPGGLDFHREFLEAPAEKYRLSYEGTESLDGRVTDVISAKPLEPAGFREARLWLDRDRSLILRIRIGMENGSVRTLTLGKIDLNPPQDPDRFKFTPPPGAQVIRRD